MPPESIIRSRQNPIYKQVRSLLRRDRRHQERAFLVEGPRFIEDAQNFGGTPRMFIISETEAGEMETLPEPRHLVRVFNDELFASVSDTVNSQGVIAVFPFPDLSPDPDAVPFIVVADGIQDPGNLGTLVRSAAAAGATSVITLPGTTDPWSPKTVRAAAAAHFVVPIVEVGQGRLADHLPPGATVLGASANASHSYDQVDLRGPLGLVIGAEGRGLSSHSADAIAEHVSIPLANGVESLNAGVAGSILLFEAARQRRISGNSGKRPSV